MNKVWLLTIILLLAFYNPLFAQKEQKSPRYNEKDALYDRGATYNTTPEKVNKRKGKKELTYSEQFDQKVKEYYNRMEANAKKYKKMEREMKKPEFSNPTYFGHKHPPKKRPPGKKKYCKICGMVH
jgi:hypothetical protein